MDSRTTIFLVFLIIFMFVATDMAMSALGTSFIFLKQQGILAKNFIDPDTLL
jgi:hypothetical protein